MQKEYEWQNDTQSVVVLEVELESAESHGFPATSGRLEAEASRVDNGNDSHRHTAVGKIDAAGAAVVLNENAEEVLV